MRAGWNITHGFPAKLSGAGLAALLLLAVPAALRAAEPWTLESAIVHALTNSPDTRIAEQRVAVARAGVRQAEAAFQPRAELQSSYTRTDHPGSVFGAALNQRSFSPGLNFNAVPDADNLNVRGVVSVPLYTGGRITAAREAARAASASSRLDAEAVRNALAFEVARAFHTAGKTREFIRAAEAAVQAFEANLSIARKRHSAGAALKTDVLDLEVRLAHAREDLARARNAHALALRALANVMGLETGELAVGESSPEVSPPAADAPVTRPDLESVVQRERAVAALARQAVAGRRPSISAFANVDQDHGWRFNGSGTSYGVGVLAHWDLWDGRLARGKVDAARAELEAVREEERRLRLAIDLEIEQARLNLREAGERLAVTAQAVALAAESVELTRARFEQGLSLAAQLIDAETALTAARVRHAHAGADRRIAIAALRKALGLPQLDGASTRP